MSDTEVLRLIEEMEGLLQREDEALEAEAIETWHQAFMACVAGAERGPGWPKLVERAHAVAERIDDRVEALSLRRDSIRQELESQAAGRRALKGYRLEPR